MPQQPGLKRERGAILAGVLVLSMVMTLAAGGYLVASSMLRTNEEDTADNRDLLRAVESVAQMAMRYMRDVPVGDLYGAGSLAEGEVRGITPGYPGWTNFQSPALSAAMHHPTFRADWTKSGGKVIVRSWATFGGSSDTAFAAWTIDGAVPGGPYGNMSILTPKDWKDSILAYR